MKKKFKGFTLIELLAVVIILAVIALIATPIVLDVISDAKHEGERNSVFGLVNGAEEYYAEGMLDATKGLVADGTTNVLPILNSRLQGKMPESGEVTINPNGQVALAVVYGETCYVKNFLDKDLTEVSELERCFIGADTEAPTVVFTPNITVPSGSWFKETPTVTIAPIDAKSGISNYKWCQGMDCEPSIEETSNKEVTLTDSVSTQICVIATDKADNTNEEKICSPTFMVDTVDPEITGLTSINENKNAIIDLREGIAVSDITSGIELIDGEEFTVSPSTIDKQKLVLLK